MIFISANITMGSGSAIITIVAIGDKWYRLGKTTAPSKMMMSLLADRGLNRFVITIASIAIFFFFVLVLVV